jgi:hypothetical protein
MSPSLAKAEMTEQTPEPHVHPHCTRTPSVTPEDEQVPHTLTPTLDCVTPESWTLGPGVSQDSEPSDPNSKYDRYDIPRDLDFMFS